jgi:hypothetical protein
MFLLELRSFSLRRSGPNVNAALGGEVRPPCRLASRRCHFAAFELRGGAVGQLARPVGRVVVDHEHRHASLGQHAHDPLDVLALVVGGQADDGLQRATPFPVNLLTNSGLHRATSSARTHETASNSRVLVECRPCNQPRART